MMSKRLGKAFVISAAAAHLARMMPFATSAARCAAAAALSPPRFRISTCARGEVLGLALKRVAA